MDLWLKIYIKSDNPSMFEGAFLACHEVRNATWDAAKKEYVPNEGPYGDKIAWIYVTGTPTDNLVDYRHLIEMRPPDDSTRSWWQFKRNALHPVQEGTPLMTRGYLTLTWARFKEIVSNSLDAAIDDSMIGNDAWFASVYG